MRDGNQAGGGGGRPLPVTRDENERKHGGEMREKVNPTCDQDLPRRLLRAKPPTQARLGRKNGD